jgi:hypothetical protein
MLKEEETKNKKDDTIPVGILHSIGRKFRIAVTNIQRPYCFTRNKAWKGKLTAIVTETLEQIF